MAVGLVDLASLMRCSDRLSADISFDRPPLVLQHGPLFSIDHWRSVGGYRDAQKLDYKLILTDARDHGGGNKPHDPQAYDLELLAGGILALLDELSETKVNFWSSSMSGQYACSLAKAPRRRLNRRDLTWRHIHGT